METADTVEAMMILTSSKCEEGGKGRSVQLGVQDSSDN